MFWVTGLIIFFLDQLSKYVIVSITAPFGKIEIIPGFFNIVHVRNTGIAFSLFANVSGASFVLGIVAFLAIVLLHVIVWRLKEISIVEAVFFGLILGGAMGNLIDRIRFGAVVDFLDFYIGNLHWPAFNVADSAITCGALFLTTRLIFSKSGVKET